MNIQFLCTVPVPRSNWQVEVNRRLICGTSERLWRRLSISPWARNGVYLIVTILFACRRVETLGYLNLGYLSHAQSRAPSSSLAGANVS